MTGFGAPSDAYGSAGARAARTRRARSTWLVLFGVVSGCTFYVDVNPRPNADASATDSMATADAGRHEGETGPPDGATTAGLDAAVADAAIAREARHAACTVPLPTQLPPPPVVDTDVTGRPAFDFFRDTDCTGIEAAVTCEPDQDAGVADCVHCLRGSTEGPGLCVAELRSCQSAQLVTPMTGRDGQCSSCVDHEDKIRACCSGVPGFDCRSWPYAADSKRGELCSVHEDCEPGLVCKQAPEEQKFGRCVCPNEAVRDLGTDTSCSVTP